MNSTEYDLLIIGGGITGAGIALDASSRGLKVALIDMQDFAAGTSSRSTKLIHGGLRYLKQLEFKLVAEVGKEREIIHRIAPHLTRPEPMLLPIVKQGSLGKFTSRLGMWLYEWLAGVKKEEWHKVLSKEQTMATEPLLKTDDLLGGILFYEYRTDDARLTLEVMKTAVSKGATCINYLKAESFTYANGIITGIKAVDQLTGDKHNINAKFIVNAGGPWVDVLDDLDNAKSKHKLHLTKGVHLVVDGKKLPVHQSLYFDTFDKRMLFVIPREGKTYIGTTDTFYEGNLVNPEMTEEDKAYILKCVNAYFPKHTLQKNDIESHWVGLRPLVNKPGKGPSEISRKDEIFISPSGLITIAGGKLTGYRKMAQRIVDIVAKKYQDKYTKMIPACSTNHIVLSGGNIQPSVHFNEYIKQQLAQGIALGLSAMETETIIYRYGSNVTEIYTIMQQLIATEQSDIPVVLRAQLRYAIEHEMCLSASDFFIRRIGALYFDIETVKRYKDVVTNYINNILLRND